MVFGIKFVGILLLGISLGTFSAQAESLKSERETFVDSFLRSGVPNHQFQKSKSKVARSLSTLPEIERYTQLKVSESNERAARDWELTLGLLVGMASATSNNTTEQTIRDSGKIDKNLYLGVTGDFRSGEYWGAELDSFFNLAPTRSVDRGLQNSASLQEQRSLQQFGALGNLVGRLPLSRGAFYLAPKVGLGFGAMGVTSVVNSASSESSTKTEVFALYATAGLEMTVFNRITLYSDYGNSFAESASLTSRSNGDPSDTQLDGGQFQRLRVGLQYRISRPLSLGVTYIRRSLKIDPSGPTPISSEVMEQGAGVLMVHF